jgi:hypothetical protein
MGMDPPIFAWEPNDLVAFESVKAAERFLEPEHGEVGRYGIRRANGSGSDCTNRTGGAPRLELMLGHWNQ